MRTTGLIAAIAFAAVLAAPSAYAQGKDAVPPPSENSGGNPVFNESSGPRSLPTESPMNSPMNAPSTSTEQPPGPSPQRWNSAAAAIWRVSGRVHVAIGYSGVRSSDEEARSSAVKACREAGGSGCKAIGAWNSGCLYITTGHSSNRAGWGSGGDSETALKKCRSYGFTCKPPIGGCVN